ncbi:MAG: Asp-tRNA(Asn)/Glu-tRNA(Gln) amidotransferase subunit GatC [Pseudomonadota bacterium]
MADIDLDKLSQLAQLALTDNERATAAQDLGRIVELIDAMGGADVAAIQPMSHPLDLTQRLRPDAVTAQVDVPRFQGIAPEAQDGFYLVPQVID